MNYLTYHAPLSFRLGQQRGCVESNIPLTSFQELLNQVFPQQVKPACYEYLDVLDQSADSRDTIVEVLSRIYHEFGIGESRRHVVVGGDAKTYQHLQSVKLDYGEQLSWLIPFPGDFHVLLNYQPILLKVYFEAGLKQIASAAGFKGETLTSLRKCSHFKHTHYFLLEAWEALYLEMMDKFLSADSEAIKLLKEVADLVDTSNLLSTVQRCYEPLNKLLTAFQKYTSSKGTEDPNWYFWCQFVQDDCFAYIALFSAIRSRNWNLRLAGLKTMAPIFCAFDRPTYRKLLPQHLAYYPLRCCSHFSWEDLLLA